MLDVIAVVAAGAAVLALIPIFYFLKDRFAKRSLDVAIDYQNVQIVPIESPGSTLNGNLALVIYALRIVNASRRNATIKDVLLTCRHAGKEVTTDSSVIATGTLSNGGNGALLTNDKDNIILVNWENLRPRIGKAGVLAPNAVISGSAVFVLDLLPSQHESLQSFSIEVSDYSGLSSKHVLPFLPEWKQTLTRGYRLMDRPFRFDPSGNLVLIE